MFFRCSLFFYAFLKKIGLSAVESSPFTQPSLNSSACVYAVTDGLRLLILFPISFNVEVSVLSQFGLTTNPSFENLGDSDFAANGRMSLHAPVSSHRVCRQSFLSKMCVPLLPIFPQAFPSFMFPPLSVEIMMPTLIPFPFPPVPPSLTVLGAVCLNFRGLVSMGTKTWCESRFWACVWLWVPLKAPPTKDNSKEYPRGD